jgi:hypothetical protein
MESDGSNDRFTGDSCACHDPHHHHNKPRIVKRVNEKLDYIIEDMGPERPQI